MFENLKVPAVVVVASVLGLAAIVQSMGSEPSPAPAGQPAPSSPRQAAAPGPERRPKLTEAAPAPAGVPRSHVEARLQAVIAAHTDWSEAELASAVADVDAELRGREWIERANSEPLSEAERQELAELLTRRDALNVLRAERLLAKLDSADIEAFDAR